MEKNNIILIAVLTVLIIIAGVQAIQFNALSGSLSGNTGGTAINNQAPAATYDSSGSGSTQGGALADLPSQVGGC